MAPAGLDPAGVLRPEQTAVEWQEHACELVTPLYGGGVRAGEVDARMPVRASAIRGQLRFWWRLLAQRKYGLSPDEARRQEFALWGGLDKEPQASEVWLRVEQVKGLDPEQWADYERDERRGGWKKIPTPRNWAKDGAAYALFPAQGKQPGSVDAQEPALLGREGLRWQLGVAFVWLKRDGDDDTACAERRERVLEALRWWATFGGLGARTRRGLGAVRIAGLTPVSEEEVKAAGCTLVFGGGPTPHAGTAWQTAVSKLRDFRQKPGYGRNPVNPTTKRPGRSRWPEADAIRRFTGRHDKKHAPEHAAGNRFPRAVFGLPIVFHFNDTDDPQDFVLEPAGHERMASPLILRPYPLADGKWRAAALLLPREPVDTMSLQMPDRTTAAPGQWWTPSAAAQVPPMQGHGDDALTAFLNYFKR
jgi:CRISPR-associated protein Cmr1